MNLPPVIIQRYFNANGAPLVGGQLFSYIGGTSTPQATYTDQTGGTPNANPIILDANGQCAMWLDPTLTYKFVLQDSLGAVQWTADSVVGTLTANAVITASIATGAVTSPKLAAGAVNAAALQSDAAIDSNRPVNTNNIKNGAITYPKLSTTQGLLPPAFQSFTATGAGTYNRTYTFLVTSANATVGATYTNNGVTYTVSGTIAAGVILQATGSAAPSASGTLTKATGSGDATIAFSSVATPLYLKVKLVGGGGGGSAVNSGAAGSTGGASSFGSSLLTANGGGGAGGGSVNDPGGTGGTASVALPAVGVAVAGCNGSMEQGITLSGGGGNGYGGAGGIGPFGGGSGMAYTTSNPGAANSGSGGQGANNGGNNLHSGAGGGAGGYVDALIPSPSATYPYVVGAGGAAAAGAGAGGSGFVFLEEHFQ